MFLFENAEKFPKKLKILKMPLGLKKKFYVEKAKTRKPEECQKN